MGETSRQQLMAGGGGELNPFASIIPLLASLPVPPEAGDKVELKPSSCLVEKGLPTLPMKLVEKVRNLEYVDMEEFLPAPCSLWIAEQGRSSASLQPVPGASGIQGTEESDRHNSMDPLLLPLHGRAVQEGSGDGAEHGRPCAHSAPPPAKGIQPAGLA